jgi:hypothetical protein
MQIAPQCPQIELKKRSSALFFASKRDPLTKLIEAKNTAPFVAPNNTRQPFQT